MDRNMYKNSDFIRHLPGFFQDILENLIIMIGRVPENIIFIVLRDFFGCLSQREEY